MIEITNRETAILGLLAEKSRYGYEIEKVMEERGYRAWTDIAFSSIYYILNRLEDKGLIESKMIDVEGKPSRRVYNITKNGVSVLQEKVKTLLSKPEKLISSLDLGIAHIPILNSEVVVECLKNYIHALDESIEWLEKAHYQHEENNSPYFVTALFSRPLAYLKTEKLWLELFVKFIEEDIIK